MNFLLVLATSSKRGREGERREEERVVGGSSVTPYLIIGPMSTNHILRNTSEESGGMG